jgi:uncharacterized protein YjiS (DUF1127 family)
LVIDKKEDAMSKLLDLVQALASEWRQRYEVTCLLDRLRKDQRTLNDIGFSYAWLAAEIRREQYERSPLRKALRRRRTVRSAETGRAAHDVW